jgi:hypothetical protein
MSRALCSQCARRRGPFSHGCRVRRRWPVGSRGHRVHPLRIPAPLRVRGEPYRSRMDAALAEFRAHRRRVALRLAAFVPLELVQLSDADAARLGIDLLENEDLVMRDHVVDGYWSLTQKGYDWKYTAPLVNGLMPEVRTLIIHYADRGELEVDIVCNETDMELATLEAALCDARYFDVSTERRTFQLTPVATRLGRELGGRASYGSGSELGASL